MSKGVFPGRFRGILVFYGLIEYTLYARNWTIYVRTNNETIEQKSSPSRSVSSVLIDRGSPRPDRHCTRNARPASRCG